MFALLDFSICKKLKHWIKENIQIHIQIIQYAIDVILHSDG